MFDLYDEYLYKLSNKLLLCDCNALHQNLIEKMRIPYVLFIFSLLIITTLPFSSSLTFKHSLQKGSSLSVEDPQHLLISPHGAFTAGFHHMGDNAYYFAIWFSDPSCPQNCTLVWIANRDTPVNGKRSQLSLLKTGNLVLTDAGYSTAWSTNTDFSLISVSLTLLDNGNLVLVDERGGVLWQSFDSPTDTLLPQQRLTRYSRLVSLRSKSNSSSGYYKLSFDEQNVLLLFYDGPDTSSAFWPVDHSQLPREVGRTNYNSSRTAVLDELGLFTSSDNFSFISADYGVRVHRRLTLDFDGNLRLYSRKAGSNWVVTWQAIQDSCQIHGSCGVNSMCSYVSHLGIKTCSCFPGFSWKNELDWSLGCVPNFNVSCVGGSNNDGDVGFVPLPHVESKGYDIGYYENMTLERCKEICSQRCDCAGFQVKFFYSNHPENIPYCFPKSQLLNGFRTPNFRGVFYLKVSKSIADYSLQIQENRIQCPAKTPNWALQRNYDKNEPIWSLNFLIWFVSVVGIIEVLGMVSLWVFVVIKAHESKSANVGFLLADTGFRRYSYTELKKATGNFKDEIGKGASGIVYKGMLSNDRVAAIKKLYQSEHGEAEFLAEASTIGGLNHMHLIDMWGYCAEGKHRLLVYEYMERGSLAQNLSSNSLDWEKRFQIAVGTARGLAYLHEECLEWILHCDLKPENILLDSQYQPKVSDFGLSKLLDRGGIGSSNFSRMRGTRGYMAPEWVYRLPITAKVDVYSYGVVMLEMVSVRSPTGIFPSVNADGSEQGRLVNWVKEKKAKAVDGDKSWIAEIVDPKIASNCDINKIELLINVALQCVEEDMNCRPRMKQVVEMLESPKV